MDNYEVIHRLGKGGCAAVYLVRHKESRKLFAMKKIELDDRRKTRTKVAVEKEARILSQLKHPHIVLYHESFFDMNSEYLNIIQDYCDGGSLDDKIKAAAAKASYFEELQIMEWLIQIIMAVQYIHSKKVLHRDLKAENVFLTRKSVVKIGDFGISKVLENTVDVAQTIVGTPSYLSPELCQDIPYSSKSDIWAVGCLLYEMCALKPPFDAQNLISLFFKIIKAEFEPIPSRYSSELQDLVKAVLVKTPDERPSASAILNMSIVKTHLAIFIEMKENLLQQKTSNKDDWNVSSSQHTPSSSAKSTPKLEMPTESASPALKRNKVKLATSLVQNSQKHSPDTDNTRGTSPHKQDNTRGRSPHKQDNTRGRSPHKQDSGLGVSSETDLTKEKRLEVPKQDHDVLSDYSDDFDESSSSEPEEEDIQEEIEADNESGSDVADDVEAERGDAADEGEYADDFEEYDSSEDLDQMVCQAREAQDIEAVDDWFADSMSDIQLQQSKLLQQQCKEALGGRGLREVGRLVNDGTLTEDDLRPNLRLRGSAGGDNAEICHFDLGDLDSG